MEELLIEELKYRHVINPVLFFCLSKQKQIEIRSGRFDDANKVRVSILDCFNKFFGFDITINKRYAKYVIVRMLFVYLLVIVNNEPPRKIGIVLKRDRTSIIHLRGSIIDGFFTKRFDEKHFQKLLLVILSNSTNFNDYYAELSQAEDDFSYFKFIENIFIEFSNHDTHGGNS